MQGFRVYQQIPRALVSTAHRILRKDFNVMQRHWTQSQGTTLVAVSADFGIVDAANHKNMNLHTDSSR